MRRRAAPLVAIVVIAYGSLLATILAGNSPELGLDLQGGASVVLEPPSGTSSDTVDQAIGIIRNRVDALGVAEPQITRQGDAVVVELPGVEDQERALEVVGATAELRFRPVLAAGLPPEGAELDDTTTTTAPTTTTTAAETTTTTGAEGGDDTTTTTEATTTTTASTVPPDVETTDREDNAAEDEVVLPELDDDGNEVQRYQLGPAELLGNAVDSAQARIEPTSGQWYVELDLTSAGSPEFDRVAAMCFSRQPECPTGQLAIELDGDVVSAPVIQSANFGGTARISGDFSEREAKDLALVLRFGALPVQLEQQTVRTVSATLGEDSLRAGLVAGLIGTALVLLYVLFYYRLLGLVVLLGLTIWFSLQWSIISYLGTTSGLALSLAGVTGIVVSVGVTVDSYIVYFERLKDEIRSGRTMRSSVDRGFKRAFRTILIADTSAFIGAATLYLLTVGPVRGFAFFLGLSTLLDVIVAWFFTRPLVATLAARRVFDSGRMIGVRA